MAERARRTSTAADATRAYIDEHPSIRESLRQDLVNFAALARKIQLERELRNEEAVTIAIRRYQRGLTVGAPESARLRRVIERSRLEVHSRLALIRFRDDWELVDQLLEVGRSLLAERPAGRVFELLQGSEANTVLCEEAFLSGLLDVIPPKSRLSVERGLAVISFRSQPEVAETPGVLAFMAQTLARRGINCLETVSVHTDSIFVFRDRDVIPAYQALSSLLEPTEHRAGPSREGHT